MPFHNQNQNQPNLQQNAGNIQNVQGLNAQYAQENASELMQSMGEITRILATQSMEIGSMIRGMGQNLNQQNAGNYGRQNLGNNLQQNMGGARQQMYQSELQQSQGQVSQSLYQQSQQ